MWIRFQLVIHRSNLINSKIDLQSLTGGIFNGGGGGGGAPFRDFLTLTTSFVFFLSHIN